MGVSIERLPDELLRRHVPERTVRAHSVVILPPGVHQLLGIGHTYWEGSIPDAATNSLAALARRGMAKVFAPSMVRRGK